VAPEAALDFLIPRFISSGLGRYFLVVINTQPALAELASRLRAAEWLAIDTEADSLHSYPEKLCLLQLAFPGGDDLVDPLAGLDLAELWEVLGPQELILHGGDYDLRLLYRTQAFVPHRVFDTMLAARLLGETAFGLTDLVERFLGAKLEKGAQKANWSVRPLTERMMVYARNDVRHLKVLADRLRTQLEEQGRIEWHQQMCGQLVHDSTQRRSTEVDGQWRLKGADRLDRRTLAVLRELWLWREREAVQANRPPFFILAHETLMAMAVAGASGQPIDPLIPRRYTARRRNSLLKAAAHALALPESKFPQPRRLPHLRLSGAGRKLLEQLRRRRDQAAARLGLDPTLIASRATLHALAADWDRHSAELLPWQRGILAPET